MRTCELIQNCIDVSNCRYVQVLVENVFKEVGGRIHFVYKRVAERLGTEDSAIE